MQEIQIALSPCPNDTFIFGPAILGEVESPFKLTPHFYDIQRLNELLLEERYPLIKISAAMLPLLPSSYHVLKVGAALGFGVGPKIIGKGDPEQEPIIAIPGRHTTAASLVKRFFKGPYTPLYCLYNEVYETLKSGQAKLGVIIHEQRFTFKSAGFYEVCDLGKLWEEEEGLPLPLGVIVAHKSIDTKAVEEVIRASLLCSYTYPERIRAFIIKHAQEPSWEICKQHIDLYVTDETLSLSEKGEAALQRFTT